MASDIRAREPPTPIDAVGFVAGLEDVSSPPAPASPWTAYAPPGQSSVKGRRSPGDQASNPPASPATSGARGVGIVPERTSVPRRVPVPPPSRGVEASLGPTETPLLSAASLYGFAVGSPLSSAAESPSVGFFSRKRTPPDSLFQRVRCALSRRMKSSHEQTGSIQYDAVPPPDDSSPQGWERKAAGPHGASVDVSGPSTESEVVADGDKNPSVDEQTFVNKFAEPPPYCRSRKSMLGRPRGKMWWSMMALSAYSTLMSGTWLIIAIKQQRWHHLISSKGLILPSTSTIISAFVSKTIELSFVTVFIAYVGQRLSRRFQAPGSSGVTLAEMTMRNWVIQPGSLVSCFRTVLSAGPTPLGIMYLLATITALFYTTCSDIMVSPKLMYDHWRSRELVGLTRSMYANLDFVQASCPSLLEATDRFAGESCSNVQFSGQSYRNLQAFMSTWAALKDKGAPLDFASRLSTWPSGTNLLYYNTTMLATWTETQHASLTRHWHRYGRIVNNVTMTMPQPGVYAATTSPRNGILQPDELAGIGEYAVRAGVVSPSIGVMCANMSPEELVPLIYTEWPYSRKTRTGLGNQTVEQEDWAIDAPNYDAPGNLFNRTIVDDIFRWGPEYQRWPPAFPLYPADHNIVVNVSESAEADAIYLLGKRFDMANYTLCELRSWLTPNCSTHFNISGTTGAIMQAHCEDDQDTNAYRHSVAEAPGWEHEMTKASIPWKRVAQQWCLSMDLNGGTKNNNASNARILTQLALKEAKFSAYFPSMAEALAVYGGSTLVVGALDSPLRHVWDVSVPDGTLAAPGAPQRFNVSINSQQYTSGHGDAWKKICYVVLGLCWIINVFCFINFLIYKGMMSDVAESLHLFTLAMNSPPSAQLKGSCGGGLREGDFDVPWRVSHVEAAGHYFFEEASDEPLRGEQAERGVGITTGSDHMKTRRGNSRRLISKLS